MLDATLIALALQTYRPSVPPPRARYFAGAIARVAADERDAAILLTNGERESGWAYSVESCAIEGIGGWGAWGVAGLWAHRYPGGTCGGVDAQARASRAVWMLGEGWRGGGLREAFGHYIGARHYHDHPEAYRRVGRFYGYLESLACKCSI